MSRTTDLQTSLKILAPDSWNTNQRGEFFEKLASKLLRKQSYSVVERIRYTGMEIDLLALHEPSGDDVYVECKFQDQALGANVIDLMIGQAYRRGLKRLALFSAGPLGKEAKGAVDQLRQDEGLSFSFYSPEQLVNALQDANLTPPLPERIPPSVSHATCIVHPEHDFFWVLQEQEGGKPKRLLLVAKGASIESSEARHLLDDFEVLPGLDINPFGLKADRVDQKDQKPTDRPEVVSTVTTADDLIDYRPCNPEGFVGRASLQKEVWDFLELVRGQVTNTRILALEGQTGAGKSSLVAKLAERFRNKKWRSKFFLFPVDVRSARGAPFVAEAVLSALKSAINAGFLDVEHPPEVSNMDDILGGREIQPALEYLKENDRVLVIFFDQFEEAFTKDELFPVFQAFRRLALDVNSIQENLVLGFSWRTGISLSDDNPAYQLWNELRDHRLTMRLGKFDSSESSKLISQFEGALGDRLLPPLRRRLQEQGQGIPWFLKKLCIHVYRQVIGGESQVDLLGGRLNVRALFDEDLEPLTDQQLSCLREIAKTSPADSIEIYDRFSDSVVAGLLEKRLVIRAGPRFAVYWDVFRDYLVEERVPFIPLTYMPNTTLSMSYSACEILAKEGRQNTDQLSKKLGYSTATITNIVTDLQNLAVCDKAKSDSHGLLSGLGLEDIPERVRSQLKEHVLYQGLLDEFGERVEFARASGVRITRKLYEASRIKSATKDNYFSRMVPWLRFAGLMEVSPKGYRVVGSTDYGDGFGERVRPRGGNGIFLGAGTPEAAVELLNELKSRKVVDKDEVQRSGHRNAAADLIALSLAQWVPAGLVLSQPIASSEAVEDRLALSVEASHSISLIKKLISEHPEDGRGDIGLKIAKELDRPWKRSSAVRYANGLWRYRDFVKNRKKQRKKQNTHEIE